MRSPSQSVEAQSTSQKEGADLCNRDSNVTLFPQLCFLPCSACDLRQLKAAASVHSASLTETLPCSWTVLDGWQTCPLQSTQTLWFLYGSSLPYNNNFRGRFHIHISLCFQGLPVTSRMDSVQVVMERHIYICFFFFSFSFGTGD